MGASSYILAQGVATPTAAYFADTLGIKRFYSISLGAFTPGSALCGLAWSLPILITFRAMQGLGGAALFPLSITLLFCEFPPQERGTAIGFFGVPALLVQGQNIAPGLTLVQLTDLSSVSVTAYVDENAINNVSVGQSVDLNIDAYSSTSFTGHVVQIVQATAGQFSLLPNQDPTSGNFTKVGQRIPVVISLDGTAGKAIVPGMSAEVTIHLH